MSKDIKKPSGSQQPGDNATVHRSFFTSRKGKRFYAVDYGHKSWPIGKSKRQKPA